MPLNTDVTYFKSGAFGNLAISIEGLKPLIDGLKAADPQMEKAAKKAIKESGDVVLKAARANATSIADDGTYAASLSLGTRSRKESFEVVLKSSDPAAGVKEFAHLGARYAPKPTDKRQNARGMMSFPVGVPRRAYAPRAMVPAINDNVDATLERIDAALADVLGMVANG